MPPFIDMISIYCSIPNMCLNHPIMLRFFLLHAGGTAFSETNSFVMRVNDAS